MTTTVVYATGGISGGYRYGYSTSYQTARAAFYDNIQDEAANSPMLVGQLKIVANYKCADFWAQFSLASVTGSVESATLALYRYDDGSLDNDQPFTLNVRGVDWGAAWQEADWVPGAALQSLPLYASLASADFGTGAYTDFPAMTGPVGTILSGSNFRIVVTSDKHEKGVSTEGNGYVQIYGAGVAGTTYDPRMTFVHGNRPEIPTIVSPVNVGYSGSISLTANAHDPNGGNVHMHWDYSTNGGVDWSACANSPSAAAANGTDITIAFTVPGSPGDVIKLRCIADDGTNQSIDYAYVTIANGNQTNMALWRSAGTLAVGDAVSGVVVSRPVSAPSSLTFTVDNFDAGEADLADDDELVLTLNTETPGTSYYWRGFVRQKRVGDLMEVYAEDISHRFSSLIVTRTLSGAQTVGTVVRAIVEDPTGAEATGIVCDVAEVEDPLVTGAYISVSAFDGQGRPVLDWLNELAEMTGAAWRVWHDGTNWHFAWWAPSANAAWAVACKDNIEYAAEDASNARVINSPTATKDRRQYVNRVGWWWDNAGTWTISWVETAAVTAGTEEPIEMVLSTRNLDAGAAESLANAYLDAYSKTRVSVEDIQLFGIRDLDLNSDVTLTLASRGITATAYPITKIEYRLLEQGHVTSITVGDPALDGIQALQRLQRRLQDVTAEVRN
jgi:hypothetical protein